MTTNDRILIMAIALGLPLILLMSGANVYSLLMATGEAVFIQHPVTAMALSALAPIASLVFEMIPRSFDQDSGYYKRLYERGVYLTTIVCFLCWAALFAAQYSAVGTDRLDLGLFDDTTDTQSGNHLLVFTQLLTEILVGSSLFLALATILHRYQPDGSRTNPARQRAKQSRDEHWAEHTVLAQHYEERLDELNALNLKRDAFIGQSVAKYSELRALMQSIEPR